MSEIQTTTKIPAAPGIYGIFCLLNGKCYIGSAISLKRRWKEHRTLLRSGTHHSPSLQRAWTKYGDAAFEFKILEYVADPGMLLVQEQYWLDLKQSYDKQKGFNIRPFASSGLGTKKSDECKARIGAAHRGRKHTAESRAAMSAARKGMKLSAEHRANIGAARLGKKQSEETQAKKRAALQGRPLSAETKAKLSLAAQGRMVSAETRAKNAAVWQGRKHSEETRIKMSVSAAKRQRKPISGQGSFFDT
jgi:group I intron endonuclease